MFFVIKIDINKVLRMFDNTDDYRSIHVVIYLTVALLLCIVCVFSLSSASDSIDAYQGEKFTINDIEYEIISDTNYEVKVISAHGNLISGYDGGGIKHNGETYDLTCIGEGAFKNCTSLVSLTIPETVTTILSSAFYGCTGLKELTLPISLDAAYVSRSEVWEECENIENVTFTPGTGTGVDYGSMVFGEGHWFARLPWYISSASLTTVNFEQGITHIGNHLLHGCKKITSLSLPNTVTSIGNDAFSGCKSLKYIDIPDCIDSVGTDAFDGCPGKVHINKSEPESDEFLIWYVAIVESLITIVESGMFITYVLFF